MPTQPHIEHFDQGLVTSKDPAHLRPGELVQADDAVYHPNDSSIHKTKARTTYNSSAIGGPSTVKGLRYVAFDDNDNLLIAHADDDLYYSVMNSAETGSFSSLSANVGTGNTLEAIQYNNRHYLMIGAGSQNQVVLPNKTVRNHGLFAVTSPPTVASTSGAWNSDLGTGYYFFITVEVFRNTLQEDLESTNTTPLESIPSFQFTSSNIATASVQVTRPTLVNSTATHWRVYMAGPMPTNAPAPPASDFRFVAEQSIDNTTVVVGNVSPSTKRFPTTNAATAGGGWTNPSNAHSDNESGATTATNGVGTQWNTFGFTGLTGTVQGIAVEIKARINGATTVTSSGLGAVSLSVSLTSDAVAFSDERHIAVGVAFKNPEFVVRILGQTKSDMWGRSWVVGDFNSNANFGVRIVFNNGSSTTFTIELDYVAVTIYTIGSSTGTRLGEGDPFPTIAISVGGITSVIGSHGLPPVATTGDIFEGQMVTNDVRDPSIIRYSLSDGVDYYPSLYFVNFETKETDEVTLVKRLGDKLLVGMKNSIFRVNYLPRESDAEFDRGRCYEALSERHGVVGLQASTTLTVPGGPLVMAFVSYSGLHISDGFQVETLSDEIDWTTLVSVPTAAASTDYLKNCILVDYPINYWLVMYYTPAGGTANTRALIFHYHPTHRKENGKMKITGPITVRADSATQGRLSGMPVLLTGRNDGKVYVEDRGYTDASGGTLAFAIKTREMYLNGLGHTVTVNTTYIRHRDDTGSTVTVTPRTRFHAEAMAAVTAKTFATTNGGAAELPFNFSAESMDFKLSEEAVVGTAGIRLSHMAIEYSPDGLTERRT